MLQWREFNYQNLVDGWGDVLAIEGAEGRFEEEISNSQRQIWDEDKVDSVAEAWNVECLRDALKKGAEYVRGTDQPDLSFKKKFMQYPGPKAVGLKKSKHLEPDMAIFLKDGTRHTSTVLVAGDNKCGSKWNSESLTPSQVKPPIWPLWPIRQVVTYCIYGKTRYGYIMTTSELVVMRVSKNPSTSDNIKYIVEWTEIPWSNSGEGTLTINLAIWWLGMLGLADEHRKIELPSAVKPINTWKKTTANDGRVTYTHILSKCVRDTTPPGQYHLV